MAPDVRIQQLQKSTHFHFFPAQLCSLLMRKEKNMTPLAKISDSVQII